MAQEQHLHWLGNSYSDEETEESRIKSCYGQIGRAYTAARDSGDDETAAELSRWAKPFGVKVRQFDGHKAFKRVCPVKWIHDADKETVEAKIGHPALKKFSRDPSAFDASALIMGPSKLGKSTAVALLLRYRMEHIGNGDGIKWFYARELATAARYHPLGEGEPPMLEEAKKARVLVLDDLGLERDPMELVDVIHARYEKGRVTFTTTGLNLDQLHDRYGEALVRRLLEGRDKPGATITCFPKDVRH